MHGNSNIKFTQSLTAWRWCHEASTATILWNNWKSFWFICTILTVCNKASFDRISEVHKDSKHTELTMQCKAYCVPKHDHVVTNARNEPTYVDINFCWCTQTYEFVIKCVTLITISLSVTHLYWQPWYDVTAWGNNILLFPVTGPQWRNDSRAARLSLCSHRPTSTNSSFINQQMHSIWCYHFSPPYQPFKCQIKSHLSSAGIIRSSPYSPL